MCFFFLVNWKSFSRKKSFVVDFVFLKVRFQDSINLMKHVNAIYKMVEFFEQKKLKGHSTFPAEFIDMETNDFSIVAIKFVFD